jgi:putative alpha-1,2-mannosidase
LLLGSPVFSRVVIDRSNGVRLTINANSADTYVQSVKQNGSTLRRSWLPESYLQLGGTLTFSMGPTANTTWATANSDLPKDH